MTVTEIPVDRITREIRESAKTTSEDEARALVSLYYQVQEHRTATANQIRENEESSPFINWAYDSLVYIEKQIQNGLDRYTDQHMVGQWSKSVVGIGPVIAAGLMAHINIEHCPSVTHIWAFAGLDPTREWKKGEKRPWNAKLKTLCWKAGDSFNKHKNREGAQYGRFIDERKRYEWEKNIAGEYADQAERALRKNIGKDTKAYKFYSGQYRFNEGDRELLMHGEMTDATLAKRANSDGIPMLPPGHIQMRAQRFTVKLFLSHWHAVAYELHYGRPSPTPYAIAHLYHVDHIPIPNWPLE